MCHKNQFFDESSLSTQNALKFGRIVKRCLIRIRETMVSSNRFVKNIYLLLVYIWQIKLFMTTQLIILILLQPDQRQKNYYRCS